MASPTKARRRSLTLPFLQESMVHPDPPQSRVWRLFSRLPILQANTKLKQPIFQTTSDQRQSPLCKLPFELREMIWKEVLGSGIMHITHLENRLGHARCTDVTGKKWGMSMHDCWGRGCCVSANRGNPSLYVGPVYDVEEPQNLLGLLMSCRTLYSETIDLLYTSYTFDFRYPHTVASFCAEVPQHRLNLITSLQLTSDLWNTTPTLIIGTAYISPKTPRDNVTLKDICEVLANLQRLKVLRIEHQNRDRYSHSNHHYDYDFSDDTMKKAIQAMCLIREAEVFEFKGPWSAEEIQTHVGDVPIPFELQ